MRTSKLLNQHRINALFSLGIAFAGFAYTSPAAAQHGYVGWNVSVGGGYRPAPYGPYGPGYGGAYGPGWGGWRGPYGAYGYPYGANYYAPPVVYAAPVVAYAPQQPMVLAAQPEPPVWYFCQASGQYFPYAQSCASGWITKPASAPPGGSPPK
ncbi:hypothetical protein SAMN06295945_1856 [Polynucleobacter meluiroseus]|uniref:Lipoprotein n=1 Tax=Polynucleobacter meluiroseus TaxID=1938814 RepID=A0A240E224_9BURK|nr:hypothetical protein [Polynucleobacter meluiroseus]SNX29479.1 hypothetical protein SAMN06295945_1856 [Polynucleobacter meluiroseus]